MSKHHNITRMYWINPGDIMNIEAIQLVKDGLYHFYHMIRSKKNFWCQINKWISTIWPTYREKK